MNSPQQFARLGSYDIFDVKLGINENTWANNFLPLVQARQGRDARKCIDWKERESTNTHVAQPACETEDAAHRSQG